MNYFSKITSHHEWKFLCHLLVLTLVGQKKKRKKGQGQRAGLCIMTKLQWKNVATGGYFKLHIIFKEIIYIHPVTTYPTHHHLPNSYIEALNLTFSTVTKFEDRTFKEAKLKEVMWVRPLSDRTNSIRHQGPPLSRQTMWRHWEKWPPANQRPHQEEPNLPAPQIWTQPPELWDNKCVA